MKKKSIIKINAFTNMDVERITFLNNCGNMPCVVIDLSRDKNMSVIAWYDKEKNTLYVAPRYGKKIIANKYSSFMFSGCENLKYITGLKNLDTSNVKDMSYMFANCIKLKRLDLSSFNTSKVTNMGGMFINCMTLRSLYLNFDTSNAKNMSYMFSNCVKMKWIDLSKFNTSKVKDMVGMFQFCSKLVALNISNFNISKVKNTSRMFQYCTDLITLTISNFDTTKIKKKNRMFYKCESLQNRNIIHE